MRQLELKEDRQETGVRATLPSPDHGEGSPSGRAGLIRFPEGLPGFPGARDFLLELLPGCAGRFLLLRSIEEDGPNLVLMPAPQDSSIIAEEDVRAACRELGIAPTDLQLLFVVTLNHDETRLDAYVNLRAPIFLDTSRGQACQLVLRDPRYPIRHPLERTAA